jgi:DNA polymerase III alpha subunit
MKQHIEKIKNTLATEGIGKQVIADLQDLREWFKANLNEPGYVKMIRLAYENIEENGDYTFLYLEDEDGKTNLDYFVALLSDYQNKYNKDELIDIRHLMEGTTRPVEEDEDVENQEEAAN